MFILAHKACKGVTVWRRQPSEQVLTVGAEKKGEGGPRPRPPAVCRFSGTREGEGERGVGP